MKKLMMVLCLVGSVSTAAFASDACCDKRGQNCACVQVLDESTPVCKDEIGSIVSCEISAPGQAN